MSWPYWARNQRARVVAPPPPPPPPPLSGGFAPNVPAGYSLVADTTFNNAFGATGGMDVEDVSYGGFGFRCYHGSNVVADSSAPSGTGYALAARSQIGDSAHYTLQVSCPTWPANHRGLFAVYSFRLNDGYRSHPSSDKTLYPSVRYNGGPILQTPMCLIQRTTGSNHRFRVEQMPRWVSGAFSSLMFNNMNGYSFPNNEFLIAPGSYVRVEYECYLETPGLPDAASDGVFRSWVSTWNGTAWSTPLLLFESTNVSYAGGLAETSLQWVNNGHLWQFYRGGNESADLATANEVTYIDRCAFYTAP